MHKVRLAQYSSSKPCYYCGKSEGITKEHAPPKTMFKAFTTDPITVPSCKEHNNEKNGHDRGVVVSLLRSLQMSNEYGLLSKGLSENIHKAIYVAEPHYYLAKGLVGNINYIQESTTLFPYLKQNVDMPGWIRQLTAAIIWSAIGERDSSIDWSKVGLWSPDYIEVPGPISKEQALIHYKEVIELFEVQRNLTWFEGWSYLKKYSQDIFTFDVCFYNREKILIRHTFYERIVWNVLLSTSENTREVIKTLLSSLPRGKR